MTERNTESYLSNLNDDFRRIEAEHFWYVGRRWAIESLLRFWTAAGAPSPRRAVEIGSGTGGMLAMLSSFADSVTAVEPYPPAAEILRSRNPKINVVQSDAGAFLAAHAESFDLIAAFDVLEHIKDDQDLLECIFTALVPGGAAVLSVPAMQVLWSSFDEFDLHFRRYDRGDLTAKLERAGFQALKTNYFFSSLFPVVYSVRKVRDMLARDAAGQNSDLMRIPPRPVNGLVKLILWIEARLLQRVSMPFGTSVVCLAVKPPRSGT